MRNIAKVLLVVLLLVPATMVFAETTTEVKSGTVVSVFNDQLVVRMANGEIKQFTVPPGFQFTVDGRQVGLSDLTPGTALSATIKTTKTPQTVKSVKIRNGEVVRVAGNNLTYRENNKLRTLTVPGGFKFDLDGRSVGVEELRPGVKLTAEVVYSSESTVTTTERQISGSTPPPPAPTYVAASTEPAPAAAATSLPKTASPLPLVGLTGLLMLASGIAVRRRA
jgi:CRISPR/Cas system-associated exonuclease Cas4 (RecB family)